jgi:hypothetical protein
MAASFYLGARTPAQPCSGFTLLRQTDPCVLFFVSLKQQRLCKPSSARLSAFVKKQNSSILALLFFAIG